MNTKFLIDLIVRQTTVLIAQLSTAAGIRAPLADIADQVFVQLSKALEGQGVPRKVVADMFGLALRSYQRKVQRLAESATENNMTLWQAIVDYLQKEGSCTRRDIFRRFLHDETSAIGSVLNDLVHSGLVFRTGSGDTALYGMTQAKDYAALVREENVDSAAALIWVTIYRSRGVSRTDIEESLGLEATIVDAALEALLAQGRVQQEGKLYTASTLTIPVGSSAGWESAVFDHFQAMVTGIGMKLSTGKTRAEQGDVVGGATLSFDVHRAHPHRQRVLELLSEVRSRVNELWDAVVAYNEQNPIPEAERQRVSFYFGQFVQQVDEEP